MRIDLLCCGYVRLSCGAERATALFEALRKLAFTPKALQRDEKSGNIRFLCSLRAAGRLRREFPELALSELGRGGLPVLGERLLHRPGLLCGVVLGLCLLIAARTVVWEVEIEGNGQITQEELRAELAASGLSCGSFIPALDTDGVALALRRGDERIAYATVILSGTVARVQIREAVVPPATTKAPADLVAACDGVITLPLAFEGECLVREGDVVRAGQVLVSGAIPMGERDVRITRAAGQILARTTHTYTVTVPLSYEKKVYTGEVARELTLHFFGFREIFFKTTGNYSNDYDIISGNNVWKLSDGRTVPVWISSVIARYYRTEPATRSVAQAYALAKGELEAQLAADSVGRTLLERRIEVCADDSGVTLICTVVCEEDVARTVEFDSVSPPAG